jgi:hypothetical protein
LVRTQSAKRASMRETIIGSGEGTEFFGGSELGYELMEKGIAHGSWGKRSGQ